MCGFLFVVVDVCEFMGVIVDCLMYDVVDCVLSFGVVGVCDVIKCDVMMLCDVV